MKYVVFKGHSVLVWWQIIDWGIMVTAILVLDEDKSPIVQLVLPVTLLFSLGAWLSRGGEEWSAGEYYQAEYKPVVPSALQASLFVFCPYLVLHLSFWPLFKNSLAFYNFSVAPFFLLTLSHTFIYFLKDYENTIPFHLIPPPS